MSFLLVPHLPRLVACERRITVVHTQTDTTQIFILIRLASFFVSIEFIGDQETAYKDEGKSGIPCVFGILPDLK